jgi:hypothetical protein
LLTERSQAIELAKVCCPVYNDEDEFWKGVRVLSDEIQAVKEDIQKAEQNRDNMLTERRTSNDLVGHFMESITASVEAPVSKERNQSPAKGLVGKTKLIFTSPEKDSVSALNTSIDINDDDDEEGVESVSSSISNYDKVSS